MAYTAPKFLVIKSRIEQDLNGIFAALRLVLAVVWAKVVSSLHIHLDWIDAQCSPLTCSLERLYDWSTVYNTPRLDATAATGTAIVTGNIGAFVLLDELLRGDNGLDYKVLAAVELAAGENLVSVRCITSGRAGNLTAGSVLTFIDPPGGIDAQAFVNANGLTGGEEQEPVEPWRTRVVDEWIVATERGGRSGKDEDYRAWAKQAHPSVTGALVFRGALGIGTVLVKPICNGLEGRLPTPAIIDAVKAKFTSIAPATADWRVSVPLQHLVTVELELDPLVDNESNRALISLAVARQVLTENSETSTILPAELDAAIATVTIQYERITPSAPINVNTGAVFVLNPVVFS